MPTVRLAHYETDPRPRLPNQGEETMSVTLWLQCACSPEPIPVATRDDPARLAQIRETLERQLAGFDCDIRLTVDDRTTVATGR